MRKDIAKLICERQRIGSRNGSEKTAMKLNPNFVYDDDFDSGPTRRSSARKRQWGYDHKQLNENLRPLFQFLDKSIGRSWDDINSEIRENIDPRRAIGYHVIQHVGWHVAENIMIINGKPYQPGYGGLGLYDGLYVHPDTGILCNYERERRVPYVKPVDSLHWYGDVWFKLEILKTHAKCGCMHFKVPVELSEDGTPKKYRYRPFVNAPAVCIHGNEPVARPIWYVVEYEFHKPDDVYNTLRLEDYREKDGSLRPGYQRWGLSEDNPVYYIYYRDVPSKLAEPIKSSKKTANRKHLKLIRAALQEAAEQAA